MTHDSTERKNKNTRIHRKTYQIVILYNRELCALIWNWMERPIRVKCKQCTQNPCGNNAISTITKTMVHDTVFECVVISNLIQTHLLHETKKQRTLTFKTAAVWSFPGIQQNINNTLGMTFDTDYFLNEDGEQYSFYFYSPLTTFKPFQCILEVLHLICVIFRIFYASNLLMIFALFHISNTLTHDAYNVCRYIFHKSFVKRKEQSFTVIIERYSC